tara:strand:- start:3263 stop:4120 length:858 start_codon:yes stop_codon:yes gene_type:complete
MANLKISELTPLGVAPDANDIIPLTDVNLGVTRSVKISELQAAVQALASNLTDISPIVQANGTMIASNGTNFVSLNTLLPTGLTQIRADLGLGTAATTASTAYATAAQGVLADTATQPADLGTAALLDSGPSNGNVVVLDATGLPAVDGSQLTGIAVTDESLRGTANPHIGAFPNQSLKVIDNPSGSVLVVSDSDGNLDFVVKTDASRAYLNTPSSRLELTTGVSVSEDSTEPDIEITTTSGTYSLITGDSDALGVNGLPIRQGFNVPDIGANPSPLLISGGTIS